MSTWCFVSWRISFSAMLVTIWMCTHEWSLISIRATAFTFATCHQPLIWSSLFTRSITVRSFLFARTGTRILICLTASAGVSLVSRAASSETGSSMRSCVSGSNSTRQPYAGGARAALGANDDRRRGLVVQALVSVVPEGPQDVDEPDEGEERDHSCDEISAEGASVPRAAPVVGSHADAERALADRLAVFASFEIHPVPDEVHEQGDDHHEDAEDVTDREDDPDADPQDDRQDQDVEEVRADARPPTRELVPRLGHPLMSGRANRVVMFRVVFELPACHSVLSILGTTIFTRPLSRPSRRRATCTARAGRSARGATPARRPGRARARRSGRRRGSSRVGGR